MNAILTYDQRLTIGVTVDPRLVPDVWLYVECLQASFAELLRGGGCGGEGGSRNTGPRHRTR